jgi:hypothetical protein
MTTTDEKTERRPLPWHGLVVASFLVATLASSFFALVVLADNPNSWPLLLYPVVVLGVPVLIRRRRWPRIVAAVLVAPIATLIFSIGLFYVPAIALMGIAAMAPPPVD